jgi:hypothetical protein
MEEPTTTTHRVTVHDEDGAHSGSFCKEHKDTAKQACVLLDDGKHVTIKYNRDVIRFGNK